jgi:hypothetical protein
VLAEVVRVYEYEQQREAEVVALALRRLLQLLPLPMPLLQPPQQPPPPFSLQQDFQPPSVQLPLPSRLYSFVSHAHGLVTLGYVLFLYSSLNFRSSSMLSWPRALCTIMVLP